MDILKVYFLYSFVKDEAEIKVIGEKRQNRELETLSSTEAALDNVPEIAIVDKTETERKF